MSVFRELRQRGRHIIQPVIGLSLVCYFAFHAFEGDRGLKAYASLKDEVSAAQREAGTLIEHRRLLESRVALLRPESLDQDMLDERARALLDFSRSDEMVIRLTAGDRDRSLQTASRLSN